MRQAYCLLLFLCASIVNAATGDVTNPVIASTGDRMTLDIEGLSTGGTYANGFGLVNGTPTNPYTGTPKVVITFTSTGYDDSGNVISVPRTIYGTWPIRKPYPNGSANQESVGGSPSKVTVTFALNEFVYSGETSFTVNVLSGFYTQGTANNAASGLTATNNSTLAHGRVVGNWSWPGWYKISGTTFTPRISVFQHFGQKFRPVRMVKITVTDGTNTVTSTVLGPSYDASMADAIPVVDYHPTIDVSSLNSGLITANFTAYPWIGDSSSILDTSDGVAGSFLPTTTYSPQKFILDKTPIYNNLYCIVDSTNGVDASGQTASGPINTVTPPAAFKKIAAAFNKLRIDSNTTYGRQNCGGARIYLKSNNGAINHFGWIDGNKSGSPTTPACSLDVLNYPGDIAANLSIDSSPAGTDKDLGAFVRFTGITWDDLNANSNGPSLYTAASSTNPYQYWFDNCIINNQNGNNAPWYSSGLIHFTRCTFKYCVNGFGQYNSNSFSPVGIIRGCTSGGGSTTINSSQAMMFLGNNIGSGWYSLTDQLKGSTSGVPAYTGNVVAFNRISSAINSGTAFIDQRNGSLSDTFGVAIVQNVFENYGVFGGKTVSIGGDSSTGTPVLNVIIWNNTSVGREMSLAYNEYGTAGSLRSNWSIKNNILDGFAIKGDYFGTPDASRVLNFSVVYGVGHANNTVGQLTLTSTGAFSPQFYGLNSWTYSTPSGLPPTVAAANTVNFPLYVSRKAVDWNFGTGMRVAGTGGGDYHLKPSSPVQRTLRADDLLIPF